MTENSPEMTVRPVGYVRSPVSEAPDEQDWWKDLVSEIVMDRDLTEALDEIDYFTYITVLFWMHKRDRSSLALKVNPMGRKDVPMRGLFATRTPDRPNPIGQTTVRLLRREENVLTVQGLDALDGSPVIDIKPWNPGYDSLESDGSGGG
jgi:tRNA-Thr(GGU) m(6)t(6)A37 methyltransferase TsaA